MANITAGMVKDLRDKTGAGMMDCKAALAETNGDMEAAMDWLRKKGITKAAKKAGRAAAEGLVGVAVGNGVGALVEVNAETDFVARNDEFKGFVNNAAKLALQEEGDLEKLLNRKMGEASVQQTLTDLVAKIGENMSVRRTIMLAVDPGVVAAYVHNPASPELGKIGVLVALKSSGDKAKLNALGRHIAMHVAAANPLALSPAHLDPAVVEKERAIQLDIIVQSGKPANIAEKMLEGRMRKFYEESVLLSQAFLGPDGDGKITVQQVVDKTAKDLGTPVSVEAFVRFQVGEGMEKVESDFADEVAKMAGPKE
ncbi:MAG: elongation factor Ts [Alphaproteobacteria bacterium]|nr:elongation factor Ts [Alphaproteobacteria bacterium]MBL6939194.1 elongation factor Ts [Alphaproteobacteria bacterium]MBL7096710.1 elongation factor Ts [Alphaproteobacteria bacterium]